MKEIRIIPCLDVKGGRVVKGINFVNLRDARDTVEAAVLAASIFHFGEIIIMQAEQYLKDRGVPVKI